MEIKLIKKIEQNKKRFLSFEKQIQMEKSLEKRCTLALKAANFAITHSTNIFSSEIVERPFLELAEKNPVSLSDSFEKGSVLHVMTVACSFGGHTRCVERWMEYFPEQKHSCILLNQNESVPKRLSENISKTNGKLYIYDRNETFLKKALKLRQEAARFEYIVLHIHPNDPIALIAFGTKDFKRPILFFNHADHIFWLGVSVSDYVADLNSYGDKVTKERRGVRNSSILGIPADNTSPKKIDKREAKKNIHIPENKRVIFSSGSAKKYIPIENMISFEKIIPDIIRLNKNVLIIIVGINKKNYFWPKLEKAYPKNLLLLKTLDNKTEYPNYLAAADLVIDSTPVGGGTALIDAVKMGKPVLTINQLQSNFLLTSEAYCKDYQTFLKKISLILENEKKASEIYHDTYQSWKNQSDNWKERCLEILGRLNTHAIQKFNPTERDSISICSTQNFMWIDAVPKKKRKEFRKKIFQIHFKKKEKIIRILGIPLLEKNENWK